MWFPVTMAWYMFPYCRQQIKGGPAALGPTIPHHKKLKWGPHTWTDPLAQIVLCYQFLLTLPMSTQQVSHAVCIALVKVCIQTTSRCLLGCDAMKHCGRIPLLQRTLLPPSSGWNEWSWEKGHRYRNGLQDGGAVWQPIGSRKGWSGSQ